LIIQIAKQNFLFSRDPSRMGSPPTVPDEAPMNLNFAIACAVVVSFAIALLHS
jgi:hypothetical protein